MAQKRQGRKTTDSSGSKDSVELGRNGEYRPAKKRPSPDPEGVQGSQSGRVRKGSEPTDEETAVRALAAAAAAARDRPSKATKSSAPPKPAAAGPTSSSQVHAGEMSSKYSASGRQEKMAKEPPPSEEEEEKETTPRHKRKRASGRVTRSQQRQAESPPSEEEEEEKEEEEEEEEKESEEEWTEPPGSNPRHKKKRASGMTGRVTRLQQLQVTEPAQQLGKEGAQPSESKKRKSKKITPAPLQEQLSVSEMPKSKKTTPAPLQQQGEDRAQQPRMLKSKRIRRTWAPSDEVRILKALTKYRRKQGKLPAPDDNGFFDSLAKRLEDKSWARSSIKDKVRSLMRRYKSYVAPTTDHEQRLADLSNRVWGDLPCNHDANGDNGDGVQDEGEHAMVEAENGGGHTVDKSFEEMCEVYPLLGQEVKRLAGVQPALKRSFAGLDGKRALLMEKKLDKIKWKQLRIQAEMQAKVEAPKARVRSQLVNVLSKLSKNV